MLARCALQVSCNTCTRSLQHNSQPSTDNIKRQLHSKFCPAATQARALLLPALQLGNHNLAPICPKHLMSAHAPHPFSALRTHLQNSQLCKCGKCVADRTCNSTGTPRKDKQSSLTVQCYSYKCHAAGKLLKLRSQQTPPTLACLHFSVSDACLSSEPQPLPASLQHTQAYRNFNPFQLPSPCLAPTASHRTAGTCTPSATCTALQALWHCYAKLSGEHLLPSTQWQLHHQLALPFDP
jgi:hypothetical protein